MKIQEVDEQSVGLGGNPADAQVDNPGHEVAVARIGRIPQSTPMPPTDEALHNAFAHQQAGRYQEAEQLYRQILAAEPNNARAWHFLGALAHHAGQHELAIQYIVRSLELQPDDPNAQNNLGLAYQAQRMFGEAIACYRRALELQPDFSEAHYNCGNVLKDRGELDEAASCYRRALELNPKLVEAHNNLGTILRDQGALHEAVACFRQALELKPDDVEVLYNLGLACQDQGKPDEAIACYRRALELNPDLAYAHNNLGSALIDQGELDEAAKCITRALELKPDFVEAHNNLGNVFHDKGNWDAAVACYERALKLSPAYVEALNNLCLVLFKGQGNLSDAMRCCNRALELKPEFAEAHLSKSFLLLLTGDFERGWPEYEWRWKTDELPSRNFEQPRWTGQPLQGKTILLHAEQGYGDTIQFIRYALLVKNLGGTVVVECQKPLLKLLATCPGVDRLIGEGDDLPQFDYHAPLLSLPGLFKTSVKSIPANVPYLFADEALIARWRAKLATLRGFRIGINWHGRAGQGTFRQRDIPLQSFAALSQLTDVHLISLQKGEGQGELARLGLPTIYLGDDVDTAHGAFMDTAAIMMNLDLVITSDTSIPHLAGALGVPVWLALPFVPDWRWLLDRTDSPWYPTMRLFRQPSPGDWQSVFAEMQTALNALVTPR